jgi:hypothetical protein
MPPTTGYANDPVNTVIKGERNAVDFGLREDGVETFNDRVQGIR